MNRLFLTDVNYLLTSFPAEAAVYSALRNKTYKDTSFESIPSSPLICDLTAKVPEFTDNCFDRVLAGT